MIASEKFAPKLTNLYVSNVRGTQQQLFMGGSTITHQIGLAPIGNNMGLFIATPSYNGKITFCVISDRMIMSDIGEFCDDLKGSFAEYLQLANE